VPARAASRWNCRARPQQLRLQQRNIDADDNTAVGASARFSNTTGFSNTANGFDALTFNTTGDRNTAIGFDALVANSTGSANTAVGAAALANFALTPVTFRYNKSLIRMGLGSLGW
jgi:hypothetical protein